MGLLKHLKSGNQGTEFLILILIKLNVNFKRPKVADGHHVGQLSQLWNTRKLDRGA